MAPRLELQTLLEGVLGNADRVYFQAPPNNQMQYDCIVYAWDDTKTDFANNSPYRLTKRYQVTYITRDPDSSIPIAIAKLPLSLMEQTYSRDNLHHYVFTLYF
jgi:hypothetical protein